MKIWIQGSGEMDQFLQKRCCEKGMMLSAPEDCDLAVLQFPHSVLPDDLAQRFSPGQKILCGMLDEHSAQTAKEKNWVLYRPLADETYLRENAALTAEGAVYAAMKKAPFALRDASCLVIGYGRIGKALTHLLRSLGAEVTVAARRPESRKEAGENSIPLDRIQFHIGKMDFIFTTVPHRVFSESHLARIKHTAFLFELASKPYGFDMNRAKALGVNACLESGVPGRYCPQSAANALFRYIERSVQIE